MNKDRLKFEEKQRVNLFLDPELVTKAKFLALKENISLSTLVDKALEKLLNDRNAA